MSSAAPADIPEMTGAKRGMLVLVVGASGVGKDTLIEAARQHFSTDDRFAFPQRVITRADQTGEPHIAVSAMEFEAMALAGGFLLSWEAHGLKYGVPIAVRDLLEAGRIVVVNTSRTIINEAKAVWPGLRVVHVTVGPEILRDRLLARHREVNAALEERLARGREAALASGLPVDQIDNSGNLETTVQQFNRLLERYADEAAAS